MLRVPSPSILTSLFGCYDIVFFGDTISAVCHLYVLLNSNPTYSVTAAAYVLPRLSLQKSNDGRN